MRDKSLSIHLVLLLSFFSSLLHAFVPHTHHSHSSSQHPIEHLLVNHNKEADIWHELLDLLSDIEHPAAGDEFSFCLPSSAASSTMWNWDFFPAQLPNIQLVGLYGLKSFQLYLTDSGVLFIRHAPWLSCSPSRGSPFIV